MSNDQLLEVAKALIRQYANKELKSGYKPQKIHPYYDASGTLIYFRIRLKNIQTGEKWIRPFHYNLDKKEYVIGEPKFPNGKPLYNLPEIAKHPEACVWIFEGETCVEAAKNLGLVATTSGSSSSSDHANLSPLYGRNITIWADNDKNGLLYANEIAKKLTEQNCHVNLVNIDKLKLPIHGDIVDFLKSHPSTTLEDINNLTLVSFSLKNPSAQKNHGIIYRKASEIEPQHVCWLWIDRFARAKYSLIVGDPGLGKSQLTCYMAAIVTNGGIWADGTLCASIGSVVILSAEDDPACTIVPRLEAAGANKDKVHIIEAVSMGHDENGNQLLKHFDLKSDLKKLDDMLTEIKDVALVIIDPISSYFGETNSHNNCDVRSILAPLSKLAEKHNVAIICISHLNKGKDTSAISRVSGSIAFTAASRATFAVVQDKETKNKVFFMQVKNNLGNCSDGLVFEIESKVIEKDIRTSRIKWLDEKVTMTVNEALSAIQNSPEDRDALETAKEFLIELLTYTPMSAKEIEKQAKDAGVSWRTVERAKTILGVQSKKGIIGGKGWGWYLPVKNTEGRQDCQNTNSGKDGGIGGLGLETNCNCGYRPPFCACTNK